MALAGALAMTIHTVAGFTNRSLRPHVAGLLGADYRPGQMTYDLRRLRLKGALLDEAWGVGGVTSDENA